MNMPKKSIFIIVATILLIGLVAGGYFGLKKWKEYKEPKENILDNTSGVAEDITESALQGVLPSIVANPLESKPDINPADKANPYKDIKTNPF